MIEIANNDLLYIQKLENSCTKLTLAHIQGGSSSCLSCFVGGAFNTRCLPLSWLIVARSTLLASVGNSITIISSRTIS